MKSNKVVFVLGAGFSKEAGFPLQNEILDHVDRLELIDAPKEIIELFVNARYDAFEFFKKIYGKHQKPDLEDIFTLLDHSINHRESCGGYSWRELDKIHDAFKLIILVMFQFVNDKRDGASERLYSNIVKKMIWEKRRVGLPKNNVSIISLNWDCLFDSLIHQIGLKKQIKIDYCCSANLLETGIQHRKFFAQAENKERTIKLLKLHGSANWFLCQNCKRLFVQFDNGKGMWHKYIGAAACPECHECNNMQENLRKKQQTFALEPFIISPTFTKVFDNVHIQMTWHNAYIELSEAERIVFIGYSLPHADYHFRTLLKRAIKSETSISVILYSEQKRKSQKEKDIQDRYLRFFGTNKLDIDWEGIHQHFI